MEQAEDRTRIMKVELTEDEYELLWRAKGPNRTWKEFVLCLVMESKEREHDLLLDQLCRGKQNDQEDDQTEGGVNL